MMIKGLVLIVFLSFAASAPEVSSLKKCIKQKNIYKFLLQLPTIKEREVCMNKCGKVYDAEFKSLTNESNHTMKAKETMDTLYNSQAKLMHCKDLCPEEKKLVKLPDNPDLEMQRQMHDFLVRLDAYTANLNCRLCHRNWLPKKGGEPEPSVTFTFIMLLIVFIISAMLIGAMVMCRFKIMED